MHREQSKTCSTQTYLNRKKSDQTKIVLLNMIRVEDGAAVELVTFNVFDEKDPLTVDNPDPPACPEIF